MRRLAIVFLLAISATTVISVSPAPGCDLLKHLLHKCHSCYHCGGHKCGYAKCHRPKCDCGGGHYHSRGHVHHGRHYGFFAPKRHYRERYYYGPSYAEPSAPVYEEIVPSPRDF